MDLQSLKPQRYTDGNWCGAYSGETFAIDNPATGETIAHMPRMGASETHRAINTIVEAFTTWCERTVADHAALLKEWHRRIQEHSDNESFGQWLSNKIFDITYAERAAAARASGNRVGK